MSEKDLTKTESATAAQKIRNVKTFIPLVDIYETKDSLFLVADMPGVDEKSVDIELEKNLLIISGCVYSDETKDKSIVYSEYETVDYERTFTLSDEIDLENIKATIKDGVLRLKLPKTKKAKPKRIEIQAA
jgi:HSP20 family protein